MSSQTDSDRAKAKEDELFARMRQVKRYRDSGHAVGRKPLFRQPNVRFEADSARIEFAVKPLDLRLQKRPLDFDGQVADAQVK